MIKTVLFDLDDTLFDYQYSRRCGLKALQGKYANFRNISVEELEMAHDSLLHANYQKTLDRTITMSEAITERIYLLCLKYGLELYGPDLEQTVSLYNSEYERTRQPIPGVRELLRYLSDHKIKIGIVTNGLVDFQEEKLRVCRLDELFTYVIISEEVGFRKPDRRIFDEALKRTGARAEETVFIGDSWPADVTGAYNCGMKAIWLNRYGLKNPEPGMAVEINSYLPLEGVLEVIFNDNYSSYTSTSSYRTAPSQ